MNLNDLYLPWLEAQVNINYKHQSLTPYHDLMMALWVKPFAWTVANDDNRVEDGLELRYLFLTDANMGRDFRIMNMGKKDAIKNFEIAEFRAQPCSVLEVIVALSGRMAFAARGEPGWWAWRLICNLELNKMKDPISRVKKVRLNDVLDTLIWRTYSWDGTGGFFPLAFPKDDQRKVELWYQMAAYLEEFNHN